MKKITKTLLVASLALVAMSCSKDEKEVVTPAVVNENNVPNGTVGMSFTVQVKASSVAASRTAGLSGSVVTISNNGKTQSATVNESGLASFSGLTEGAVQIFVKAPAGYLSVNTSKYIKYNSLGSVVISPNNTGSGAGNDSQQSATEKLDIELFKIGASVKGKIYGNFDFNFGTPTTTIPSNVKVIATIDNSFEPNVFTTSTDGNGGFSFDGKLPEGVEIDFHIDYQTTNTVTDPSKPVNKDWEINRSVNSLLIGNTLDFGNIDAN